MPLNLPPIVILQASVLLVIGAYYLTSPLKSPIRENEQKATIGSASLTLGLAYLLTSHVPIEENQLLHASVPLRLVTATVLPLFYLRNRKMFSEEGRKEFLYIAVFDGLMGLWLGWSLGRFDGRVSGSWF